MKSLTHIRKGTDESQNTYKHVRAQHFTGSKTRVKNTYFFNDKKATKHDKWTVQQWFADNFDTELETIEK